MPRLRLLSQLPSLPLLVTLTAYIPLGCDNGDSSRDNTAQDDAGPADSEPEPAPSTAGSSATELTQESETDRVTESDTSSPPDIVEPEVPVEPEVVLDTEVTSDTTGDTSSASSSATTEVTDTSATTSFTDTTDTSLSDAGASPNCDAGGCDAGTLCEDAPGCSAEGEVCSAGALLSCEVGVDGCLVQVNSVTCSGGMTCSGEPGQASCGCAASDVGQPCGECGGEVQCDGSCSVATPETLGDSCGACGGVVECDGACSVETPATLGESCNDCGGTVQCDGTCPQPLGAFGTPTLVLGGVDSLYSEDAFFLSDDGSTAYISSNRPNGAGAYDIWSAPRISSAEFGDAVNIAALNSALSERGPSYSAWSGPHEIYFQRYFAGGAEIMSAVLNTNTQTWGTPSVIGLNTMYQDQDYRPGPAPLFVSNRPFGPGGFDIYSVSSNGTSVTPLPEPVNSISDDAAPTQNESAEVLFLGSARAGGLGQYDIWAATDTVIAVEALNSDRNDYPAYYSPDGCLLYFASTRLDGVDGRSGYDIFVSAREAEASPVP